MSTSLKKLLAIMLAVCLVVACMAGCKKKDEEKKPEGNGKTLVVGYSEFSEKFSPFFAKTAYDQDAADITQVALIGNDRGGNLILKGIEGETVNYNGTDYTYTGIADVDVDIHDNGFVYYTIKIRDDIKFSDGKPLTIDDVIFNMYVLSDPTYDGSSTFYALPIKGMDAYRSGMESKANLIIAAGRSGSSEYFTADESKTYWAAVDKAGEAFVNDILEYCKAYGATKVGEALQLWGFDVDADASAADCWKAMEEAYGGDIVELNSVEQANLDLFEAINAELGDKADTFATAVQTGNSAANISGITRVDDTTLTVCTTKFSATTIYSLGISVAPMHYYGDEKLYDYDNNQFGFVKGDLSSVRSKTTKPLGAGPYVFEKYENGVITYHANTDYFKGAPKTQYLLFQEGADADKLAGLASGQFDITDPSFSTSTVDSIKEYNSNHELTGNVITTNTVDNLGYGYIGICASNVKVGDDKSSDASKSLRKAFATLFSVYRDTVINSYYGERASVIQYPISNTSWAAPRPADEGYRIAYSKAADGSDLYKDGMSEQSKYEAALNAAIDYFKAAGFTFDEASGKFTEAPEGASLVYEAMIPGDGIGDHPAYGILIAAKDALAPYGITLEVNDLSNSNDLWTALEAGQCQMWAAAWGAALDPDMYQVYHSSNIVGLPGSTESNHYSIQDPKLDELIIAARQSADQSYRKATYKQCLDIILDWAVEIPTYQRQNAVIFSTERVDMDTVTPDITTFYGWAREVENIEVKD
ncbi:MAG: ABC transporter substrate-binding protein [Clostridia bacterium]|nr:ABC transporter substrate-binding protein [Clostridia bacterium]